MAKTTKPSLTARDVERMFGTEAACKALLVKLRWPDGTVACPRCGETKRVYALHTRPFHWVCKNPSEECPGVYRFSVLTGTVFESSNMPLTTWFKVAYLMATSKKGTSALQVYRMMPPQRGKKGSYKTFWYMCHRIRAAMQDGGGGLLGGIVEVDETFIGGKIGNRHVSKRRRAHRNPRGFPDKVPVVGAIARKGNVVCQAIQRVSAHELSRFVKRSVDPAVELIATDENAAYHRLSHKDGFPHETVNHAENEYVRGVVHTANLDSFWSLLKRGIMGSYHKVSATHLPLYLNEFSWRHNHRNDPDIFYSVLAGC